MCSAPAGMVESYGTSSGSAIASELACCPYQAAASSDQERPVPAYQMGDYVSVDMDADISTSEEEEFYGQQSQGAESVRHQVPIPATTNDTERKNLSPYPSTGFLPPAHLYNQTMYKDPTPRSPIQQASDLGNGVLNHDQACYIHPNQRGRNVLRDHLHSQVLSLSRLPDARTEGFPHSSKHLSIDVKDGDISQLGVRCKDPSTCIPDINAW